MDTDSEIIRLRADNLRLRAVELVRGIPGIVPTAVPDLARVLIENGLEATTGGGLRFSTGGDLDDAVNRARIDNPHHFLSAVVDPAKADLSGLSAAQRLARANGDDDKGKL